MTIQQTFRKIVSVLLVSVVIVYAACGRRIEESEAPDAGTRMPQRGLLRVTKLDGATITLRDFVVRNDSIVGFFATGASVRTAVARTDVSKLEVSRDTMPRGVRIAGEAYKGVMLAAAVCFAVIGTLIFALH